MADRENLAMRLNHLAMYGAFSDEWRETLRQAACMVEGPEAVEPKKPISADDPFYVCGNCGLPIVSTMYQFCPYCGSKVKWTEEDEDD